MDIKKKKIVRKKDCNIDNKIIKNLGKKLKIKKTAGKYLPKSFLFDGLDYLLDVCYNESKKNSETNGEQLKLHSNESDESDNNNEDAKSKYTINKKRKIKSKTKISKTEIDININYNDHDTNKNFDSSKANVDLTKLHQENNFKNEENLWEDIYGRKQKKDGNILENNQTPTLKLSNSESNIIPNEDLLFLKKKINCLLNKLAESNMHIIVFQLDELYMLNSRNNMNDIFSRVMLEALISPTLTPEWMIIEHMMCLTILHANIGIEVGAYFITIFIQKLNEMITQLEFIQNKKVDNLCLMISHLYNFKVFGSQLIFQIFEKLIQKFDEKVIELILLFLKTIGFRLRKDNPIALKDLILNLHQKISKLKCSNFRINFMLEMLLAIKNNNTNKFSSYNKSQMERLKKKIKTLIRKGNTITQLNVSFEDLINVDKNGKWWIGGSACFDKTVSNNKLIKSMHDNSMYTKKILHLAQIQKMNTDVRKNIFCILMTAEDYLDAFEKLHLLGLKDHQEREIINVILNCLLQEQKFNPYYSVLLQKFCEYDRKYQLIIQYLLWDKMKIIDKYNDKQIQTMAKLMSHLFIQKALPLSILKAIELEELDTSTMKLFRKIMLDILMHENIEVTLNVFERITFSVKLHEFKEGLRLFINYFLLKNIKKENIPQKQFQLLEKRIEIVDKILQNSNSKISF